MSVLLGILGKLLGPLLTLLGYGAAAAGGAITANQRDRAKAAEGSLKRREEIDDAVVKAGPRTSDATHDSLRRGDF